VAETLGARRGAPRRFSKNLQNWWLAHWGSTADASKGDFALFLEYAATIKGAARDRLLADARAAVAAEVPEVERDDEDPATKALRKRRIRAKKVARALEAPA